MKWVWATIAALLIVIFAYFQANSVKTSYINGLAAYNTLPNREYILQRDCYIFKSASSNSTWPLIGDHGVFPALPKEISTDNVGTELPDVRILDIARVGDRVRIVSVRKDEGRHGSTVTFELLFTNEGERKYPRVDALWILDHSPEANEEPPVFRREYAAERVKG